MVSLSPPPPPSVSPVAVAPLLPTSPIGNAQIHILPFPSLPNELIICILYRAVHDSHSTAYSISLVSKWARKLVLPYLFSTIVYRCKPSFSEGMSSGSKDSPHARNLHAHEWGHLVRSLWSESLGIANSFLEAQTLSSCPNVENLALVSGSLRTLASLNQVRNAINRKQISVASRPPPTSSPFLHHLREMTIISVTFRHDWQFLVGLRLSDGSELLRNITHIRLVTCAPFSFSPHNLLPNLTHLALPYLEMRNHLYQEVPLRFPPGLLERSSLRMIVLTVDEEAWLKQPPQRLHYQPWKKTSPKMNYRTFVKGVAKEDDRLYVILSPHNGVDLHQEWVDLVRRGMSIWEIAERAREEDSHGECLPDTYPELGPR